VAVKITTRIKTQGTFFNPNFTNDVKRAVKDKLRSYATSLRNSLERAAARGVKYLLKPSWKVEAFRSASYRVGFNVYNDADYADADNFGRRPAWVPFHPLFLWVVYKLNPANPWAVTKVIQKNKKERRTEGKHYIERSINYYERKLPEQIESEIMKVWRDSERG
jgi:hypothetical protein